MKKHRDLIYIVSVVLVAVALVGAAVGFSIGHTPPAAPEPTAPDSTQPSSESPRDTALANMTYAYGESDRTWTQTDPETGLTVTFTEMNDLSRAIGLMNWQDLQVFDANDSRILYRIKGEDLTVIDINTLEKQTVDGAGDIYEAFLLPEAIVYTSKSPNDTQALYFYQGGESKLLLEEYEYEVSDGYVEYTITIYPFLVQKYLDSSFLAIEAYYSIGLEISSNNIISKDGEFLVTWESKSAAFETFYSPDRSCQIDAIQEYYHYAEPPYIDLRLNVYKNGSFVTNLYDRRTLTREGMTGTDYIPFYSLLYTVFPEYCVTDSAYDNETYTLSLTAHAYNGRTRVFSIPCISISQLANELVYFTELESGAELSVLLYQNGAFSVSSFEFPDFAFRSIREFNTIVSDRDATIYFITNQGDILRMALS